MNNKHNLFESLCERYDDVAEMAPCDRFRVALSLFYVVKWNDNDGRSLKLADTKSYGRMNVPSAMIKLYAGPNGLDTFNRIVERINTRLSSMARGVDVPRDEIIRELNFLTDWLKNYTGITLPKMKKDKYSAFLEYVDKCATMRFNYKAGTITAKVSYKTVIKNWLWNYAFAQIHNIPVGYVFEADLDDAKRKKQDERNQKKAQKSA